ncbi:MAG: hypothetical protein Q8918_10780 [Bacteroidota bacterium]|nr:hypothetical protein [Bacteroidota bacterium]MDP4212213.1 hypothetical protein [Bacteroidota bacterium]MDP4250581.1 hypothetical protein [Bacteroidota bacterium]
MLTYFLFPFYLIAGTIMLHAIIRRKGIDFTIYHTAMAVLFKVFLGCLYGYIFLHYYGGDDTWGYFLESRAETDLLLNHPLRFIREFLPGLSLQAADNNGWRALVFYVVHFENWFMVKSLAVLNLLSGKNYYIDVLWFDLITMAGPLLLFKVLVRQFPSRAGMYYLLVFFIPSVVFWCSGIRAEALILLFISIVIYNGKEYAQKPRWKNAAGIVFGLAGFLLFRAQYLVAFLPALLAYMLSVKNKRSTPVYFNTIYLAGLLIFISSLFLPPALQLSRPLIQTQQNFMVLHGNTRYRLDSLQPGPLTLIEILPQALANSALRPYPWEGKGLLQSLSSIENIFLFAGFLFFVISIPKRHKVADPVFWLFLYYGITLLLGIGYTVPFPGAIVRYRCIPFLFLFIFLFSTNNLLQQKLTDILFKKHYKNY